MSFAENLKQIRKDRSLSQEELAELLEVSRQAISKWEQGVGYPEVETLLLLSKILHISLDSLMADETPALKDNSQPTITGIILIPSFDGTSIVKCYKILSSSMFKAKVDEPKYALFGVDGYSFWGEHSTVLGWYETEENLKKETQEILEALKRGDVSYELHYAVKVKRQGLKMKIIKETEKS